jgi:hypothetical protein
VSGKLRVLALVVSCGLAACGGGSSNSSEDPSTTAPRVTDSNRATTLPLRTSDLPSGFAAVDIRNATASPMVSECLPGLLIANATQIGEVFFRDDDLISSQSYVLSRPEDSRSVLTTLGDPAAQACLSAMLQGRFAADRDAHGLPADLAATVTSGSLDPATAHYRVTGVQSAAGTTRTALTVDMLLAQSDRSISAVWLTWVDGAPEDSLERSLVTALRARATAAFSS